MAGQSQPNSEYECRQIMEERRDWGFKGNVNRVAATERVTSAAVESAPGTDANCAHVITPSEFGPGGDSVIVNVNAFRAAKVVYYKCANLPAPKS